MTRFSNFCPKNNRVFLLNKFFCLWFLVTFVRKLRKYLVIFVSIFQGKMSKTERNRKENHAIKMIKIPKTKRRECVMNKTYDSLIQMEINRYQNTIFSPNFQPINNFYLQFESHFKWPKRQHNFWTKFRIFSDSDTEWRSKERFSKFETGPRPVPKSKLPKYVISRAQNTNIYQFSTNKWILFAI